MKLKRCRTLTGWAGVIIGRPIAHAAGWCTTILIGTCWIWTAVIVYASNGVWQALASAGSPIVAQCEVIWALHRDYGVWITNYSLALAGIPVVYLISVAGALLALRGENAELLAAYQDEFEEKWREQEMEQRKSASA